jgi:hypothetical protein
MEPVAPLDAAQEQAAEAAARRVSHVAFGCGLAVALLVIAALLVYLLWTG